MSNGVVPKPTSVLLCDICGEEIQETTYRGGQDHRGQVTREAHGIEQGSVTFGWIAHTVSNLTRRGYLLWPPGSWARTKAWNELPPSVTYDFHGECILRLVEEAKASLEKSALS